MFVYCAHIPHWPFLTAAVLGMCVAIKLVEGRIAWHLDINNNALELYKASQFMLALLMAFRVVRDVAVSSAGLLPEQHSASSELELAVALPC